MYTVMAPLYPFPGLAARLTMDTAKANFTPNALHIVCARPATFITTTSPRKNNLQLFMPAREINIYAIHTEHATCHGQANLSYGIIIGNVTVHRYREHHRDKNLAEC